MGKKSVLQTASEADVMFSLRGMGRGGGGGCPNCGLGEEESGEGLYCTDLQTLHLFKNKSI